MRVELSERGRQRVEELVQDGSFQSPEAVVEAALEQMTPGVPAVTPARITELLEEGYADIRAGRVHPAETVLTEARSLLASKSQDL